MEAIYILLTVSLLLGLGFLAAFLWATHRGQFDDAQTPAMRMLLDDWNDGEIPPPVPAVLALASRAEPVPGPSHVLADLSCASKGSACAACQICVPVETGTPSHQRNKRSPPTHEH